MVDSRENTYGLSQDDLMIRAVAVDSTGDSTKSTDPEPTTKDSSTKAQPTTTSVKTTPKETTAVKTTSLSTLAPATTSKAATAAAAATTSSSVIHSATAVDPYSSIVSSTSLSLTTGLSSSSALPSASQSATPSTNSSSNTGLIAGIAGGVGAIVVLGAFVFFMIKRNRRRASTRVSRTMDQMFSPTGGAETTNQRYADYNSAPSQSNAMGYEDHLASPTGAYIPANNTGAAGQYYASDYGYHDNQQMYQHMDDSYSHGVVSPTMAQDNQLYRANTMMTAGGQQEQGMYYDSQQQQGVYHESQQHQLYYDSQPQMYQDQYYDSQQQAYHDPQQQAYHDPQQQGYYQQQEYHGQQQAYGHQQADYYPTENQQSHIDTKSHNH
ncbi:hypothetical protein K501DRAFT_301888 [Backusella circina FSU 941]|nr:hypothetical protein K501DRAFT_301888 [Backusella circina FSU 941]